MNRRPSLNLSTFTPRPCGKCGSAKVTVQAGARTITSCPSCDNVSPVAIRGAK